MTPTPRRVSRAFTLIELVVVIVIMGVLAAVSSFAYTGVLKSAHATAAQIAAVQVATTVQAASSGSLQPYSTDLLASAPWAQDTGTAGLRVTAATAAVNGTLSVAVERDGYCAAALFPDGQVGADPVVDHTSVASTAHPDGTCG